MKVIILGAGEVGFHIADQLIAENKDVVLMDKEPERLKYVSDRLDCITILGDGTSISDIRKCGVETSEFFIAATDSDEVNLVACMLISNEFDTDIVKISRLRKLDYLKTKLFVNPSLGIDYVVNHETEAAKNVINTVSQGAISEVTIFNNTQLQLNKVFIDSNSLFKNRALKDIKSDISEDFLFAGIHRKDDMIIPSGNTVVRENDHIYLIADQEDIDSILKKGGKSRRKLKNIVVVGGGKIGEYITDLLVGSGKHVKLIDNDYEKCKVLSEKFPSVTVLNADISDDAIFEEEQIFSHDLIITTTDNEELNILAAIYAKSRGTKKSLAMVSKQNYLTLASNLGIDATVSPKLSAVNAILKFLRKGNIKNIHSLFDGRTEIIEFKVSSENPIAGKKISEIKFPKHSLIAAVGRNSDYFIPNGNFQIQENDSVTVFTKKEALEKLEEMFNT